MSEITEEKHMIATEDDFPLASTVFRGSSANGRVIVIASGLGVPRYAYFKFARFLASRGFKVICFDYRGIFESQDSKFLPSQMKMAEWGSRDVEAVLQFASNELNATQLYYIGHSAGGQLVGLAPSSMHLDAAVFLSVVVGYWKLWPALWKWGILLFCHIIPLLTWQRSNFPAKLVGFSSVDIPAGVVRQWSRWGRSPRYLFDYIEPDDFKRYRQLDMPLLAITFDDDYKLGPKLPADKILSFFDNVKLTRRHIKPAEYSKDHIGHFGFFKEEFKSSLWREIAEWLDNQKS